MISLTCQANLPAQVDKVPYIYEQEHAWSTRTERRAADAGTKERCTVEGGWEWELLKHI
jgi:hypothetical protein